MAIRRKKSSTTTTGGTTTGGGQPPAPAPKKTSTRKAAPAAAPAANRTSGKTTAAARPSAPAAKPRRARDVVEELQAVGADVVPRGTVEADVQGSRNGQAAEESREARPAAASTEDTASAAAPDEASLPSTVSEALTTAFGSPAPEAPAADQPVPGAEEGAPAVADPVVDPAAIREHTIDQIEPELPAATALLTDWDFHLFNEGTHYKLWQKLGSHPVAGGTIFGVWAPNAARVSVIGDFNDWNTESHPLQMREGSGLWEGFIPNLKKGTVYKYHIVSRFNDYRVDKADPFAVHHEPPPRTASIVWNLDYEWNDADWMRNRKSRNSFESPMTIYEVHLGSWRRATDDGMNWRAMTYREMAGALSEYVKKMNFTHVELMPVMEHPFYGSWGYQGTGYFAPTSRYGTPQDFKYLVDVLHQNGIGVILDWVPSHFPTDEHGLGYFDGTHLFEHADPRKGFHPDWSSLIFNYGRNEVRSFLLSSALYWLDEYHADGLRVDAVASMLYLDYSRKHGEWIPNEHGGRENIEAIAFLRRLNEDVYKNHPDVQVIAEESTAWPMVSRPVYVGGLGFGMKWDMGWMHDSLRYFSKDPVHRKYHHNDLTFRMMYAFTENFVLPLSHDEVVHGKGSLIGKMPGDDWQKFANLRLLFAHMYANPGKKLVFMGGEFGQWREWNHDTGLDWHLYDLPLHAGASRWVEDLNKAYRDIPAFHELDMSPDGFEWIDCCDTEGSIVSLMRRSKSRPDESLVAVMNFTPLPRQNYQIGVPRPGEWIEILNSDAPLYGGSGRGNMGVVEAMPIPLHGRRWSVNLTLPPLGAVFLLSRQDGDSGNALAVDADEKEEVFV